MLSGKSALAVLILALFMSNAPAAEPVEETETTGDTKSGGAAIITSESLKLSQEKGWMEYTGDVRLTRGDVTLIADRMRYNREEKVAEVEGNVLLIRGRVSIACDKMTYNLETNTGVAEFVHGYAQSWYGWGEEIKRVGENQYQIINGYVTTDPYPKPGWKVKAKKIDLYPGDKVIARNVGMYVGSVPVVYLPYYRASLKDEHSPLSVEVGHTDSWGYYILVAYDILVGDGLHLVPRLDYRSKRGWAEGVDLVGYQANGGITETRLYFAQDDERPITMETGEELLIEDDRYRADLRGYHPVGENWDIRYELHKYSDEDFLREFFRREFEDDSEPETYMSITRYDPNWTFNVFGKAQVNDFYTTTERLPEVSIEYAERRIGSTPFYHDGIDSIAYLRQANSDMLIPDYDSSRVDVYHRVSYPNKYFGWLNIVPRVGGRMTYYSDGPMAQSETRYILDTDVDFFTQMFKIWDYEDAANNIHGLRHVVEPEVHYFYTPTPDVEPEELFQFDAIDELDYVNVFRLGLRNKLQTKRYGGSWDLVDLYTYIDYFPKPEEYDELIDDRHFSDFGFDLEVYPSRHFKVDFDGRINTYDNEVTSFNTQVSFFQMDQYGINFEYHYRNDENNLFATEGYVQLNDEYAASAYLRYEAETSDFEEAEVTLFKDLRTWVGAVSFRHLEEEDENQVWLSFRLKALAQSPLLGGN